MLKNPFTSLFGNRGVERSQTRQQPRSREEAIEMGFGTAPAPYIPPEIQEAIDLRKDANDSREIASDQYESDVADFKNNLATEKEKGIASLPQAPVMAPRIEEPIFTPPPPVFRDEPIEDLRGGMRPPMPPPSYFDDEPIFTPPPPREEPIFTPPPPPVFREEPIFTPPFEDEPIFTPPPPPREEPIFTPPPPSSIGRPPIFDDEPIYTPPPRFDDIGTPGGPDFNGNINFPGAGTNPFDNIFTPTPPPTDTEPVDPGFGGDGTFPNIDFPGLDQDALDELLERLRREGVIPPGDRSGDYRGPYDPPNDPPEDIILPPPAPSPAPTPAPPPSGPINPYTGEAMRNPYTPYEQPSNESNFNRAQMMDPRRFGQAPGFEPPRNPILTPIKLPPGGGGRILPPIMCFVAGTKIDMADGTKKVIENIMVGDEVMALNNTRDKVSYVHDIPEADRKLWTINNRITATDSHAFLTEDGWKSNNPESSNLVYCDYNIKVSKLNTGDKLITNEGVEEVIDLENKEAFVKVYNFSTDATHTYMVDGVVSHNKMPPPDDRLFPENEGAQGMNMGGGISQLPMQGQGDTLTTQVFQAGFRPRR